MVVASPGATSTAEGYLPFGLHLVGSVPLGSADEVFRALAGALGDRLRRLPDGETGPRADWIVWQYPVLSSRAQFEVAPPAPGAYRALPRLRLRPDADPTEIRFGSLGYAEAAVASYGVFRVLKRDGVVPVGCRFQVSLTLAAWARVLRPAGTVRINSGNLRDPRAAENEWIIDETVYVVHEVATGLVRTDPRYAAYRAVREDDERMRAYLDYRDRVFRAPRPLEHYVDALSRNGFDVDEVTERTIEADVDEWYDFLAAYADAVLGWVGGSVKVDGMAAPAEAAGDRLRLLHDSVTVIFGGRQTFRCCWTYISATRRGEHLEQP